MYAKRIDANQVEVVKQLRKIPGVTVAITSQLGSGFPDLVVGYKKVNYLIELKDGKKSKSEKALTGAEELFMFNWNGQYSVCESFPDCCKVIGIDLS
jgi:hypothetical protein